MSQGENRRRIGERLVGLQVGIIVVFAALGICFWVLQIVQHGLVRGERERHRLLLQQGQ